jgi:Fe2+ or Zn2+ uptake regulation protein
MLFWEYAMSEFTNNMRLTSQRQVILEELQKVTSHPTANEVFDMVRKRLPRAPCIATWISCLKWVLSKNLKLGVNKNALMVTLPRIIMCAA